MRERILIVFIALAIGLVITTLVYFLYQQTKSMPQKAPGSTNMESVKQPTPTSAPGYLVIKSPTDATVVEKRQIQVKGMTHAEDTLIVSTNQEDVVAQPAADGSFSVSITIDAGANLLIVRSISPNGTEHKDTRVITFSTEEF